MDPNSNNLRCISKTFKCPICLLGFKKLVPINETIAQCPKCGHKHCSELINSEFNRESVDKTYRIPMNQLPHEFKQQFHPKTDLYDRTANNLYGDSRRGIPQSNFQNPNVNNPNIQNQNNQNQNNRNNQNSQNQNNQNQNNQNNQNNQHPFIQFFIPFNISPFAGSVNRAPFDFSVFNGPIGHETFENPSTNFFLDNFASNFISNFINPMTRIVFINSMQNQHQGNPPAAKTSLEKLKHFNMEKKYCKKDEKDPSKIEYPTCSICLMDINDGQKTILLPCGHMFHDECVTKWLNIHNTCPLCRFELPTDDPEYERKRSQRNTQRNENISRNPNVRTADLNNPGNLNEHNNQGNHTNINIQGESAFN